MKFVSFIPISLLNEFKKIKINSFVSFGLLLYFYITLYFESNSPIIFFLFLTHFIIIFLIIYINFLASDTFPFEHIIIYHN